MKILHISTSTHGGAGRAAMRLHLGLLKIGVNSHFLAMAGHPDSELNIHIYDENFASLIQKIFYELRSKFSHLLKKNNFHKSSGKYEIYSSNYGKIGLKDHPLVKSADIINLHWVASFIDYETFFKSTKTPIVWTLHDMNPFQGGFHYLNDQIKNTRDFKKIEEQITIQKQKAYKASSIEKIITPSLWLKGASEKSELLGSYEHFYIPYSLDTSVFKPSDTVEAKQFFNLPLDKKVVMFLSEDTNNYRKGFDVLFSALKMCKEMPILLAVGKKHLHYPDNVKFTGKINEDKVLAKAYSAADVVIIPSREDNLPNVMLESLSCATPVITARIGGMQDVIKTGVNGILIDKLNPENLASAITDFLKGAVTFDPEKIRKQAVENFQIEIQAEKYKAEYLSMLNLKKA